MRIIVVGNLCACGCGGVCKNRFISGHNRRSTTHVCSEETKVQVSAALMGHSVSQETRDKIRLGHIGKVGWKKGLTKETDQRVANHSKVMQVRFPQQEEVEKFCECGCENLVKAQGSRFLRGHSNGAREKVYPSQETKNKMKVARVHFYHPEWNEEQIRFYIGHKDELNNFCLCGCGEKCNGKFVNGHNQRGMPSWNRGLTKETSAGVASMSKKQTGRPKSDVQREKQRQAITGRKHTQETLEKMKISHIGINVGRKASAETVEKLISSHTGLKQTDATVAKRMVHSGMRRFPYIFGDGTVVKMRSHWEVLYAEYLDSLGISWKYESKGFLLSTGHRYFPDFYLLFQNEYHEIKGWMGPKSAEKIDLLRKEYPDEKLVVITKLVLNKTGNRCISFKKNGVSYEVK